MMVRAGSRITTTKQAANDPTVLAFGWLQGAANRLEYILGRALAHKSDYAGAAQHLSRYLELLPSAPDAAPNAAPRIGFRNGTPIRSPQRLPVIAPIAVVLTS